MSTPTIEQLMKLVQDEGYFYTIDNESSSEIRFARKGDDEGGPGWGWRIEKVGRYEKFEAESAADFLGSKNINFNALQGQLLSNISLAATYHRYRTKAINKAMGIDFSDEALRGSEAFGKELITIVESASRKSKLRLVEG